MALNVQSLSGGMSRRRHLAPAISEINVTPFVDVMLVLLVIFMVTAPMMTSGIGIDLPSAETDSAPADEGLTLSITRDEYIHIGDATVNINLLERRLKEHFWKSPKKVVYLRADERLPFGFIVKVMDITKKAGIEVIGIVTEPIEIPKPRK